MRKHIVWVRFLFMSSVYAQHELWSVCLGRHATGAARWLIKEAFECPTFFGGLCLETVTQPSSRECLASYAVVAGGTYACSQCTPWWPFFVCGCGMCVHSALENLLVDG